MEQELPTIPQYLSSPPVFSGVRVTGSLVLYVRFVDRCLYPCPFSLGYCVVCPSSLGYCVVCPFSLGYCVVCPFSLGYCVVCPFSLGCCVVCPFSLGYCVVCPSSLGYCVVCPSSLGYCVVCPSSLGYCVVCPSSINGFWLPLSGADPGFQVRGAHLKKLRRADGGAKMFGIFHLKNHDFTPTNLIFSNFRGGGGGGAPGTPHPGSAPAFDIFKFFLWREKVEFQRDVVNEVIVPCS